MAGSDRIQQNTNERYTSADINDAQDLAARFVNELSQRYRQRPTLNLNNGAYPDGGIGPAVVIGGLTLTTSAANLIVAEGATVFTRPTTFPVAGANDSPRQFAMISAPVTITPPVPVVDTWYLIRARATLANDPTVNRDVYQPGSQSFLSTAVVKRQRLSLEFDFVAGTTVDIPLMASSDEWVEIGAVFRPAGGGPITNAQIIDLRPMRPEGTGTAAAVDYLDTQIVTRAHAFAGVSTQAWIRAHVRGFQGEMNFAITGNVESLVDLDSASIRSPTTVYAANTWYYLYLCSIGAGVFKPRHHSATHRGAQGVLVMSSVGPNIDRYASATIQLPAPFSLQSTSSNDAVCIAALRRNGGNTGWNPTAVRNGHGRTVGFNYLGASASGATPLPLALTANTHYPLGSRALDFTATLAVAGAATVAVNLRDTATAGADFLTGKTWSPVVGAYAEFDDVPILLTDDFELVFAAGGATASLGMNGYHL